MSDRSLRSRGAFDAPPSSSSGTPNQYDPNLLPRHSLGDTIDVVVEEDCDDWIPARHRVISQKDDRLTAGRNLNRASSDPLAGQLLPHSRVVAL